MKPRVLTPLLAVAVALAASITVSAQSVTWQILPWYEDSAWGGFLGHPALNFSGRLIFEGRPARTVQTFTAPKTITLDATLDERQADDGSVDVSFIPTGLPTNLVLQTRTTFRIIYRGAGSSTGSDALTIEQLTNGSGSEVWGEVPFVVEAGKSNRIRIAIGSDSKITLTVNNVVYVTGIVVPYSTFQVQVSGWQPLNRWTVRNFRVQ